MTRLRSVPAAGSLVLPTLVSKTVGGGLTLRAAPGRARHLNRENGRFGFDDVATVLAVDVVEGSTRVVLLVVTSRGAIGWITNELCREVPC